MNIEEQMREWRHYLHRHPETAFEEKTASQLVAGVMKELGFEVETGIGKTGVVGTLKCGDSDRVIGLRADMDALNVFERGEHDHVSENPGKMHGCGHDGHVTMLLGAAKMLAESRDFNGTVRFVFQPAEEPGWGAGAMIEDGLFERFPMDEIYGMHNAPYLPAGVIATRVGGMATSEDDFTIKITGKGGHASSPHEGVDPLACFSEIYIALQTIVSRNSSPVHPVVVSCTEIETDGAHNAIPTYVEVRGDARTTCKEDQEMVEKRMRDIVEGVCRMNGAKCEFIYTHEFQPTVNDAKCVAKAVKAAEKALGSDNVMSSCDPWMASEDFALYLHHVPGCFVMIGSAKSDNLKEQTPLHNNVYDYNDEVLIKGAEFWTELVRECLPL